MKYSLILVETDFIMLRKIQLFLFHMTTGTQNIFWCIQLSWRFKLYFLENGFCVHFHVAQISEDFVQNF
jgi:hypothetical protein